MTLSPYVVAGRPVVAAILTVVEEEKMTGIVKASIALALCLSTLAVIPLLAQEFPALDKKTAEEVLPKKPYSPYMGRAYPMRVYWGDTHLHTSQSFDAVMFSPWSGGRLPIR